MAPGLAPVLTPFALAELFAAAHDDMRSLDGLQPQEAFDELLKYLFVRDGLSHHHQPANGSAKHELSPAQLRGYLSELSGREESVAAWQTGFRLSDQALHQLQERFADVAIAEINLDVRSAAMSHFLAPSLRRGLGIFLTPDSVAETMVQMLHPGPRCHFLDPACGSGTFLLQAHRFLAISKLRRNNYLLAGVDRSPRMLLMTQLNFGGDQRASIQLTCDDSLLPRVDNPLLIPGKYDVIATNPPFGVRLESKLPGLSGYLAVSSGRPLTLPAEVLFLEQCLRLLRPGGRLGIVLPRSVVTNRGLADVRNQIGILGRVTACLGLPPETFHLAGTQTTTFVLILERFRSEKERHQPQAIAYTEVANVGHDSTGRPREGSQLPAIALVMNKAQETGQVQTPCRLLPPVPGQETLARLGDLISGQGVGARRPSRQRLGDYLEHITPGKTPARSQYSDVGLFLVKVGNLTGRGLDWNPRARNFLPGEAGPRLLLQPGDLLLTACAHSPRYIAAKVDVVTRIPRFVGGRASFTGEVLLLRPDASRLDPFALLAYLRSEGAREKLQRMIRGQTAHLHPADVAELELPGEVLKPTSAVARIISLLKTEARLAYRQSLLAHEMAEKLEGEFGKG